MCPVRGAGAVTMFDGVVVDVIDVVVQIAFVADRVFPEAPLPDAAFAL